jgi:hypothetical protein
MIWDCEILQPNHAIPKSYTIVETHVCFERTGTHGDLFR